MRLVFSCLALLFLGLFQCALATDYELTVDRSAKDLLDASKITIIEPYGLIHGGDRIVSFRVGTIPNPSIPCKVISGSEDGASALSNVRMKDYSGGFAVSTKATDGATAYSAGLLMHTANVSAPTAVGAAAVSSVWSEGPWIWIALGAVGLFLVIVSLIRLSKNNGGGLPLYGKKVYEDNLRDVKARLERISEAQELLVAKPPVLRTFRKQIARFEHQLEKLQTTAVTTQQALAVLASTTVELQTVVQAIAAHQKEQGGSSADLHRLVERSWTEQRDLSLTTKAELDKLSKHIGELAKGITDTQAQLSKEWQNEQTHRAASEQSRLQAQSADSARMKQITDSLAQLRSGLEEIRSRQSTASQTVSKVQAPTVVDSEPAAPVSQPRETTPPPAAPLLPEAAKVEPLPSAPRDGELETNSPEPVFGPAVAEFEEDTAESDTAHEAPFEFTDIELEAGAISANAIQEPSFESQIDSVGEAAESVFANPELIGITANANALAEPAYLQSIEEESAPSEWSSAGGSGSGTWSSELEQEYTLLLTEGSIQAVCPAETPGIEHPVGAMVYHRGKVIYAHGDHVRGFWPGKNPRSVALSHPTPQDPWRLLILKDRLFCVADASVDVVDLNAWTRNATFAGHYSAQCAAGDLWCGLKADSPALEFRDALGISLSPTIPLPEGYSSDVELLSDGNVVYAVAKTGRVCRIDTAQAVEIGNFELSDLFSLEHAFLTETGVVALVSGPAGISIRQMGWNGRHRIVANSDVKYLSGNVAAIDHLVYFFDAERSELVVCDTRKNLLLDAISLPDVEILRRLIGLKAGANRFLLIAGSDGNGLHGSVFLLDPRTEKHVLLCSTNQPHVDAILAGDKPVVATSNSFQNIIRIFEPFEPAAKSDRAA